MDQAPAFWPGKIAPVRARPFLVIPQKRLFLEKYQNIRPLGSPSLDKKKIKSGPFAIYQRGGGSSKMAEGPLFIYIFYLMKGSLRNLVFL